VEFHFRGIDAYEGFLYWDASKRTSQIKQWLKTMTVGVMLKQDG
jgi:hypothetical protein